jgi:hypothetical protein
MSFKIAVGMGCGDLEPLMLDWGKSVPSNRAAGGQDGDGFALSRPE